MRKTKVVFKDGARTKVAVGDATFEDGFVKLITTEGNTLYINKEYIVFMKEGEF